VPTTRGRQSDPAGGFLSSTFQLLCRVRIFSALALGWFCWFLPRQFAYSLRCALVIFSDGAARRPIVLIADVATVLSANAASGHQSTGTAAVYVPCRFGFGARQLDGQQQSFTFVAFGRSDAAVVGSTQLDCGQLIDASVQYNQLIAFASCPFFAASAICSEAPQ